MEFHHYLPRHLHDHYDPNPLGRGTRMVVFKARAGNAVIRVPLRSEEELIRLSGEYVGGVSQLTYDEVARYDVLQEYLGKHLVPVTPLYATDEGGNLRTYSTQRFVSFTRDARSFRPWETLEPATQNSLESFIADTRRMVAETGLIPDLAGQNNLVVNGGGKLKLIDVNNIRPLLSQTDWWIHPTPEGRREWHKLIERGGIQSYIHADYLDDKGYPAADASLLVMRNWESHLGRDEKELDGDELYDRIADGTMRKQLLEYLLRSGL